LSIVLRSSQPYRNGTIVRFEKVREEWTDVSGIHVLANILSAVYRVLGEPATWTEPGRDMTLPDAAWDILHD